MNLKNKFTRILVRVLGGITALLVLAVIAGVLYRSSLQNEVAERRAITTENGIETIESTQIGGIEQVINIRGKDLDNPVILFVHGGPGMAFMPFSHIFQDDWEDSFTVVQWDQRGAGKTYFANDPDEVLKTMSLERVTDDVIEMSELLRSRLKKKKIFIVAHSWGTVIGTRAVKMRPDLYHGYVGTGQVVSFVEGERLAYAHTLQVAKDRNNQEAIKELEAIAPYPDENIMTKFQVRNKWNSLFGESYYGQSSMSPLMKQLLRSPEYSLRDLTYFRKPPSLEWVDEVLPYVDLRKLGTDFEVPMFFFEGAHEWQTAHPLAKEYYISINAPVKNYISFNKSSHFPFFSEPEKFARMLKKELLPLVKQ
ncbi:alpha/beta hydrolase [Paremcibacter congregatus]|uniref:alpha/beta fold hydrolase n=1 Tax=Paremcibacter congregatus TaxID=2043170 RepID=UPI0030EDF640|tara:strand:+ start:2268 stop:3365 length:1098 start_codon:yes stop_codon:yes gene_type:complete